MEKEAIGFIGTGVMGASMAGHLMAAGYPLTLFTRTREKAADLLERGAQWAQTPAELASQCRVVLTMVGYPRDVEEIYFREHGLLAGAQEGSLFIDLTTSEPALAVRIAQTAAELNCEALDAPVSGGDRGAREATLSIMVGGSEPAFARALPLFEVMGKNIVHQGPAGSGQHCKLANQVAIASGMLGVCEAIAYAEHAGLDPARVLESISGGAAGSWSLSNLAPRMLEGDFAPGFYVKHFIKDMRLAEEAAKAQGLAVPGLSLALARYEQLAETGCSEDGTQALYKLYRQSAKND